MQRRGPEYQRGWRTRIEVEGVGIDIVAMHATRTRMPRGHEMSRQMVGRGHLSMVDEIEHEWRATAAGRRQSVVRQNPNGSFSIDGRHVRQTDLVEAVTAWATADIAVRTKQALDPLPAPKM